MNIKELQNEINKLDEDQIGELIHGLPHYTRDVIYCDIWFHHVKDDIESQLQQSEITLTEDEINHCARRYVYDFDYDCAVSYWNNIHRLIDEEWEKSKNR